jgi:hypothetical protein
MRLESRLFRFLSFSFPSKWEQAVERTIREVSSPHQSCLLCSALRAKMSSATTHNLTRNILNTRPSKNSNSQGTKDASCTTPSGIRFQRRWTNFARHGQGRRPNNTSPRSELMFNSTGTMHEPDVLLWVEALMGKTVEPM